MSSQQLHVTIWIPDTHTVRYSDGYCILQSHDSYNMDLDPLAVLHLDNWLYIIIDLTKLCVSIKLFI